MLKIQKAKSENSLYEAVDFVARATDKNAVSTFRAYIYRDKEFLVASDTHRMHVALLEKVDECQNEVNMLENGAYEIIQKGKNEIKINKAKHAPEFPNDWKRKLGISQFKVVETATQGKKFGIDKALTDTLRACPKNMHFQIQYLQDVFRSDVGESWVVLKGKSTEPYLFKNTFKSAVVMPCIEYYPPEYEESIIPTENERRREAMKKRVYKYNTGGFAVDEAGSFISLKNENTDTLLHRKKLLQADLWRCRKVRPAEIKKGERPSEQAAELEKATVKILKALERINAELKRRKAG